LYHALDHFPTDRFSAIPELLEEAGEYRGSIKEGYVIGLSRFEANEGSRESEPTATTLSLADLRSVRAVRSYAL